MKAAPTRRLPVPDSACIMHIRIEFYVSYIMTGGTGQQVCDAAAVHMTARHSGMRQHAWIVATRPSLTAGLSAPSSSCTVAARNESSPSIGRYSLLYPAPRILASAWSVKCSAVQHHVNIMYHSQHMPADTTAFKSFQAQRSASCSYLLDDL